ncbi:hypothetical protein PTT_10842 [Pyrenophora teres f. teres 0-1]|uniref:Uncharacterized protein n=1 Tax=Pyrenophora teres f. teres (strain 0-1) TaxID=861557 RepID=E3RQ78_PYRTT|nr:hypothetical protein PTT_10842 [Pyrenophora teres f. teres 0-1]
MVPRGNQTIVPLQDKREKAYFLGHDNPEEIDQMQTVWLKEYDEGDAWECQQPNW